MTALGFSVFDSALGCCGIAWSELGVVCLQLPAATSDLTRTRLTRLFPAASEAPPPPALQQAIEAIVELLRGEPRDLRSVLLDMRRVPAFQQRVYAAAREIPPGKSVTYGELARRVGAPGAARAVGRALGQNPFAIVVPCHRVVAAGGKIGGFSAPGGAATKRRMLEIEQCELGSQLELIASRPRER